MEQTVLKEKERFTQIQWDMEELRKQCMEMESLLNSIKVCASLLVYFICIQTIDSLSMFLT